MMRNFFFSSTYNPIIPDARKHLQKRYILKEVIGQGSFGCVRKCQDRRTRELLACKSIRKSGDLELIQTIQKEVSNLRRVGSNHHPNLVEFVQVYEDTQFVHIVTELCQGGELYDQILAWKKHQAVEEATAATILSGILQALAYLHDVHHICHRDLKASNFLFHDHPESLDPDANKNHIKIIDFGLSIYVPPSPLAMTISTMGDKDVAKGSINEDEVGQDSSAAGNTRTINDSAVAEKGVETLHNHHSPIPAIDTISMTESVAMGSSPPLASPLTEHNGPTNIKSDIILSSEPTRITNKSDSKEEIDLDELQRSLYGTMTSEVGTPYYVAPEVLLQEEYTCLCDVWSIGVIAYLILSGGALPFQGADERATIKLLMNPNAAIDYSKLKNVSPEATAFCRHLLQRDPTQRPTAWKALSHPWLVQHCGPPPPNNLRLQSAQDMALVGNGLGQSVSTDTDASSEQLAWGDCFASIFALKTATST